MSLDFDTYIQWSAWSTLAISVLAIIGFVLSWGIRFRLVGIAGFLIVLTTGLFGLNLGFLTRTTIPGAVRYSLAYDNGANITAIAVPATITETELRATLRQASADLFSSGRSGIGGDNKLTIRARALTHPKPGITMPLYIGEAKRSLAVRQDEEIEINIFPEKFSQLN